MTHLTHMLINSSMTDSLLLAQYSSRSGADTAASPMVMLIQLIIQLAILGFVGYCTQAFLTKLNYENAWFGWIPVVQIYAILEAGEQEQPLLWTLLGLIPCVGLISLIKIIPAYIRICERLGKPPAILWTFLLCGLGGLIVPFILAFT
jgi:hypothetical protein